VSTLAARRPGLVFFEDGSFSDGPLCLRTAAAASSRNNPGLVEVEQCVSLGGRARLRVTHTIALRRAADVAAEQCVPVSVPRCGAHACARALFS
jgi:hypothetical protein